MHHLSRLILAVVVVGLLTASLVAAATRGGPGPIPTPDAASTWDTVCQEAATKVGNGDLKGAEDTLAGLEGHTCKPGLDATITVRRQQAQTLADVAKASMAEPEQAGRYLTAALAFDNDNSDALALQQGLGTSNGIEGIGDVKAVPAQGRDSAICAAAQAALDDHRYALAEALVKTVAKKDACAEIERDLAAARARTAASRIADAGSDAKDWLIVVLAFLFGGLVLTRLFLGWEERVILRFRSDREQQAFVRIGIVLSGLVVASLAVLVVAAPAYQSDAVTVLTLIAAVVCGVLLATHLVIRAPLTMAVKSPTENDPIGQQAVAVIRQMVDSKVYATASFFGVPGATDTNVPDLTPALETISSPVLKALTAMWRVVSTGSGDAVAITVTGEDATRSVRITYSRARAVVFDDVISAKGYVTDGDPKGADGLACGVAARVVFGYLGLDREDRPALPGLYGAGSPSVLALAAATQRRISAGHWAGAAALARKALSRQPDYRLARYLYAVSLLRQADAEKKIELYRPARSILDDLVDAAPTNGENPIDLLDLRALFAHVVVVINNFFAIATANNDWSGFNAGIAPARASIERLHTALESKKIDLDARQSDEWGEMVAVIRLPFSPADERAQWQSRWRKTGLAGLTNMVNWLTLLAMWIRIPQKTGAPGTSGSAENGSSGRDQSSDFKERFLDGLAIAGSDESLRNAIVNDPVIRIVRTGTADDELLLKIRTILDEWDPPKPPSYAELACLAGVSDRLAEYYPDAQGLRDACRDEPEVVGARARVPLAMIDVWVGALDWLLAGRSAQLIGLYQAAGFIDADSLSSAGEDVILTALNTAQGRDRSLPLPRRADIASMRG